MQYTEAGGDIAEWNEQLNAMPREQPCDVLLRVSCEVPHRVHVPLRVVFNRVLAYICRVTDNIQMAGTLHPLIIGRTILLRVVGLRMKRLILVMSLSIAMHERERDSRIELVN